MKINGIDLSGAAGTSGSSGTSGVSGSTGAIGATGANGSSGTSGVSGSSGTSVASVISRAMPPTSSWILTNMNLSSGGLNNTNYTINTIYLAPYVPARTFTYTGLSVNVNTAVASTNCKILIYDDVNGIPTNKILESTALSKATTGIKTYTVNGTMSAGVQYWMGVINDTGTGQLTTQTSNGNITLPFLVSNPTQVVYGYLYTSSYTTPAAGLSPSGITSNTSNGQNTLIYFQQAAVS